jgi:hypothetical protein
VIITSMAEMQAAYALADRFIAADLAKAAQAAEVRTRRPRTPWPCACVSDSQRL